MNDQTLIERVAELIQVNANAKQVYGEPVERDGTTIIPVAKVQWGFGAGSMGHGAIERGGGGGGARAIPAGFIEMKNGTAQFRSYHDPSDVVLLAGVAVAGALFGMLLVRRGRK